LVRTEIIRKNSGLSTSRQRDKKTACEQGLSKRNELPHEDGNYVPCKAQGTVVNDRVRDAEGNHEPVIHIALFVIRPSK